MVAVSAREITVVPGMVRYDSCFVKVAIQDIVVGFLKCSIIHYYMFVFEMGAK